MFFQFSSLNPRHKACSFLQFTLMQKKGLLIGTIVLGVFGIVLLIAGIVLLLPKGDSVEAATDLTADTPVSEQASLDTAVSSTITPVIAATVTETAVPTATQTPEPDAPTPTPTIPPTPTPTPVPVNGLPPDSFVILPPDVQENIRTIYANGQQWGRDSDAFSVLGDSTALNPHLLARFGEPELNLGPYSYLQPTVDAFADSWSRYGVAARHGLHSWSVLDPLWANKDWCLPEEDLLTCEIRLQNPAYLIIRLGSNDAGAPSGFAYNMRQMVEVAISNGVIPIIMTKADRFEGDNTNNEIMREVAANYKIPIWDFDVLAETLPNRGLDEDQIHTKEYLSNDFTLPETFESGHAMQDLSGLMVLDAIRKTVQSDG